MSPGSAAGACGAWAGGGFRRHPICRCAWGGAGGGGGAGGAAGRRGRGQPPSGCVLAPLAGETSVQLCVPSQTVAFGVRRDNGDLRVTVMSWMRIAQLGFAAGRQKITLERCTTPTLPRRTCSARFGLHSWYRGSCGRGVKRPRELLSQSLLASNPSVYAETPRLWGRRPRGCSVAALRRARCFRCCVGTGLAPLRSPPPCHPLWSPPCVRASDSAACCARSRSLPQPARPPSHTRRCGVRRCCLCACCGYAPSPLNPDPLATPMAVARPLSAH
jgi:hypothetical protein